MNQELLFATSGYSSNDTSVPDLSVFRITENGHFYRENSLYRTDNPSYLTVSGEELYVACENGDGATVAVYRRTEYAMKKIKEFTYSFAGLCHLAINGNRIYGSCFIDGTFFCADTETGNILWKYNCDRPNSHAHETLVADEFSQIITSNYGTGEVSCFTLKNGIPKKKVLSYVFEDGSSPRSLIRSNDYLYCTLENSSEIAVFFYNGKELRLIQRISSTGSQGKNYPSNAVIVDDFLYVGNRGVDSISIFKILCNGQIEYLSEKAIDGKFPRHIEVYNNGRGLMVSCQKSDEVELWKIQKEHLTKIGSVEQYHASCTVVL